MTVFVQEEFSGVLRDTNALFYRICSVAERDPDHTLE